MDFTIALAGVPIAVRSRYDEVYTLCRDYLTDEAPAFSVTPTEDNIRYEAEKSRREALYEGRIPEFFPASYLETLAVYRQIAVAMLDYGTFLFHGSVIAVDGTGYLFTAPSGTGKTTHTGFWLQRIPGACVINGDKPLLKVSGGTLYACGTPWAGKEGWNRNCMAPLRAICLLSRGEENRLEEAAFSDCFPMLLQQTYRPGEPQAMMKTIELLKQAGKRVRLYRMACNLDSDAALVAYEGMREERAGE